MVRAAFDIDATLGKPNYQVWAECCNSEFDKDELHFDQDEIELIQTSNDFFHHKKIKAARQQLGEQEFNRKIGWVHVSTKAMLKMHVIDQAREAAIKISRYVTQTGYYTCRYSKYRTHLNQPMAEATQAWLFKEQFPSPSNVVFCKSPQDKLERIAESILQEEEIVILFDDHYLKLLQVSGLLQTNVLEVLQQYLILGAFGLRETITAEQSAGIQIIAVPTWEQEDLVPVLDTILKEKNNDKV